MMGDQATKEALNDCVRDLGLTRPLLVQYADSGSRYASILVVPSAISTGSQTISGACFPIPSCWCWPVWSLRWPSASQAVSCPRCIGAIRLLTTAFASLHCSGCRCRCSGSAFAPHLVFPALGYLPADWRGGFNHSPGDDWRWGDFYISRRLPRRRGGRVAPSGAASLCPGHYAGCHGEPLVALGDARSHQPGLFALPVPRDCPSGWWSTSMRCAT